MSDQTSGEPEQPTEELDDAPVHVRAFLIADIRGYTSFTQAHGDEAAAELATDFARLMREGVEEFGGAVIELRGDEALATFPSTRQALRSCVDLQRRYFRLAEEQPNRPPGIGIGVDAGEAVPVEGGYRGAALNRAARLCSAAAPGQILTTETVMHLAGTVSGIRYEVQGPVVLKGVSDPVKPVLVTTDDLDRRASARPAPLEPAAKHRVPFVEALEGSGWQGFGEQIHSMVREHMDEVNQQLKQELGRELDGFHPGVRGARPRGRNVDGRSRGRYHYRNRRASSEWLLPVIALFALVVVVVVLLLVLLSAVHH